MKNLNKILCACSLFMVSFGTLASTYSFDGELAVYEASGNLVGSSTASALIGLISFA